MDTCAFSFSNTSDSVSYGSRKTTLTYAKSDNVEIDGAKSKITTTTGGDSIDLFSGYFPRLVRGYNYLSIKNIGDNVFVIIRTPVARWIT